ncbi:MAG: nuclear transport factor 2 family protein [Planctomycetaceae bacterium]|nr:nuclear transport factor 2 family protein [Planctomycetaceae bacterium]
MIISRSSVAVLCLIGCCSVGRADDKSAAALQEAIEQSANRFVEAYSKRDAKVVASLFTSEAEYVDGTGTVFHGRAAIEAEFAAAFDLDALGILTIEILSIRPVAPGVVVEEGVSTLRAADASSGVLSRTRYAATHVQQPDGSWLLASVRELETLPLTPHEHLASLSWLEGWWKEEVGGTSATTEWTWSEDENFLISHFTVHDKTGVPLKGSHRIGWDAERQQFRSWVFDSTGGSAEGWWVADEHGAWTVQMSGVDAEGVRLSSVLTFFRDGADGLVITQDQRVRGDVSLPAVTHRVVRQPPAPGERVAR